MIICDPAIMMGKPVIAGTRITVELILEKLAAGERIEQILEAHPRLTPEAVLAALRDTRQKQNREETESTHERCQRPSERS
jgi:uncharacterized protein (DUF433 family)